MFALHSSSEVESLSEASQTLTLAFCSECRREFPVDDLMPYGGRYICVECKPLFLQRVREGVANPTALRYGSVGSRFMAILIDGIMLELVNRVLSLGVGLSSAPHARGSSPILNPYRMFGIYGVVTTFVAIAYYVGFLANGGATPGKMAMGLRVVTAEGLPVSYGRALGRYFALILDSATLGIGYLIAFFDDERRALHDRICGTRVITADRPVI